MPRPRPPHLHREIRPGGPVFYVRRAHGPRTRLAAEYGSDAFWQEYRDALAGKAKAPVKARPHTLRWLVDRYRHSSAWAGLANATRRQRENIYRFSIAASGDELLSNITVEAIRKGREDRLATPHAANNFLKAMRSLFAWAVSEGIVADNPTTGVKMLHGENDAIGFHTWTEAELDIFEATWRVGTRERLAFDLMLYTGLRRGDAVRVGRQHVRDGLITLRAEKTGEELFLPILSPLAESIAASPTGDLAFLVSAHGEPWIKESFGNWFGEVCRKTGLPKCSAHGLRKAGATRAAERGATDKQLMAIFGWTSPRMAAHYTRSADKRRLAMDAAKMLLPERQANVEIPQTLPSVGAKPKTNGRSIR